MIYAALNWLIVFASAVSVGAYVCRLSSLQFGEHKLAPIVMHMALFGTSVAAGIDGWQQRADLQTVLGLGGAAAWICVSWRTWKTGVPWHMRKGIS